MRLEIINGPNLSNIGKREPEIYGNFDFNLYFEELIKDFPGLVLNYFQSHTESEIVNRIHQVSEQIDGIVLNAGAYSHTSVAIRDAISSIKKKVVLVHISNVYAREHFRHNDIIAPVCAGIITGFGLKSYKLAIISLIDHIYKLEIKNEELRINGH